ncbi:acyl-CoA dehydrogenase family protein [Streptomyces sp. NPDC006622]|uniref:acyl-CoA dehydrogenase family protein n=1 Tax=Streptomyces sp. NPDC006622 TaxID=3155459 RepID=UPI0033AF7BCD
MTVPVPETGGASALVAGAHIARTTAHRTAAEVERLNRLTGELARAVTDAGFARHFVPHRWGGVAGTFTELVAAVAVLGQACASTAWCAALYAAHGRLAAYLPVTGQRELWEAGPDVRLAAAVVPPSGEAVASTGGWRLTGRWGFASGADHADWLLLASWTGTGTVREQRIFVVPFAACEVLDTWRNVGLKGTGSNTVAVTDVFVPEYRTFTLGTLARTEQGAARCHAVPYRMVAPLQFAAPVLGAAQGALDAWVGTVAAKRGIDGNLVREAVPAQQTLTRAAAEIEAARLLLHQAARRADRGEISALTVAANGRDAAKAADLCVTAVGRLMRGAGARSQQEGDPVQQRWRDVTAAAGHPMLDLDAASSGYAQAVFAAAGPGSTA